MKTFYQIALENEELERALQDAGGEVSLSDEERIAIVNNQLIAKVDGCVSFVEMKEAEIEYAKKKLEELKAFIKYRENEVSRFNEYAMVCMDTMNVDKLEGEHSSITIRKNPPSVNVIDESALPPAYKTVVHTIKVNKGAIKDTLKSGVDVAGAELTYGRSIKFGIKKK